MKKTELLKTYLIGLIFFLLLFIGCSTGSDAPPPPPTLTTASAKITTATGVTGAAAVPLAAPAGVKASLQPNTTLTDGAGNPVPGDITAMISYSLDRTDLPAAAATALPPGNTLAAFVDISMGAVKHLSLPLNLAISVTGKARPGDALAVYSFDSSANQWILSGTEIVDANSNITPSVSHFSLWGAFENPAPLPPAKPSGITITLENNQVTVSWTPPATGADSYNIYYATTAGVTIANGTQYPNATSPQVIPGLTNDTTYYFVVTAVNASGESTPSSEKSATPSATPQPPGSPTGVVLTSPSAGAVTVGWNPVGSATSYNVYYSTSIPLTVGVNTNGTVRSSISSPLEISGLAGTTYYFLVTAVNAAGESDTQNNPKSITPSAVAQPPASPTGVSLSSPSAGAITISWTPVTEATSYNVYYSLSTPLTTGVNTTGTVISSASPSLELTGLPGDTTYYFLVTAVSTAGESGTQNSPKSITPGAAPQPPPSPNGVSVTSPATGTASITWSTKTGATSYNVYYSTTQPLTVGTATNGTMVNTPAPPLDIPQLISGTTYYFLVTSVNAAGESGTQNSPKFVTVQ